MSFSRRRFLGAVGLGAGAAALSPLIKVRKAWGSHEFQTHHLVIVGIGGGLRNRESLGMAEGITMPNLFGTQPLISGFSPDPGPVRIAPEYEAAVNDLALPAPRSTPLFTEGSLITNLRYAEGAPGHLQGQACLLSGYYNNIENRADARLPVPTIFEIFRREANQGANSAWYVSVVGGFYRALQASSHPQFGARYGGTFLSPPGVLSPLIPIVASGKRSLALDGSEPLPIIPHDPAEDAAVNRLRGVLDGNTPSYASDKTTFRATPQENADVQQYLAAYYADNTYQSYYPDSVGIGVRNDDGNIDATNDALCVFHAEQILEKFKPGVLGLTLIDIDQCHGDFNAYLRAQLVADAAVNHLWNFIQSTDGLRDNTTMLVLPEHGRHLYMNGQNPDSYGRSGIDHGQGDDGDRDIWMLALGPDIKKQGVIEPTGITQNGRTSGRYESIDVIRTGMQLLGHGDVMASTLESRDARPGLVMSEVLA